MRALLLAGLLAFTVTPALCQSPLGMGVPLNQEKPVSPEEAAKRRATEEAYKSTIKNIPAATKSNDPWGNMRSVETTTPNKDKAAPKKSN